MTHSSFKCHRKEGLKVKYVDAFCDIRCLRVTVVSLLSADDYPTSFVNLV